MKFFLILFPLIFLTGYSSRIDNDSPLTLEDIKTRKLIVVNLEPNEKHIKQINSRSIKDDLKLYYAAIDSTNKNLLFAIDSLWDFHSEYQTMNESQVIALKKTKTEDYIVVYVRQEPDNLYKTGENYVFKLQSTIGDIFSSKSYYLFIQDSAPGAIPAHIYFGTSFSIAKIEEFGKNGYGFSLPHFIPYKSDFKYGMDKLVWQIEVYDKRKSWVSLNNDIEAKTALVKEYNLIILETDVESPEKFKAEADKIYLHNYTLVDKIGYDKIVLSQEEGYAYLTIGGDGINIVRASDGMILYTDYRAVNEGGYFYPEFLEKLN